MAHSTIQIIDSHIHILQPSRFHYHWLEKGSPLNKDIDLPTHMELDTVGVVGGILIEATNSPEEIPWLLEISQLNGLTWGVIGWIHLEQPDAPKQIEHFAHHPHFKGIRLNWLESRSQPPTIQEALKFIAQTNLVVDVLARWEFLPDIMAFVRLCPNITFVLEHFGGIRLNAETLADWKIVMKQVADHPNIFIKLSGYTAATAHSLVDSTLRAYVETALQVFGINRLMFGSNYPMGIKTSSYAATVEQFRIVTGALSEIEQRALFHNTARQIYNLS